MFVLLTIPLKNKILKAHICHSGKRNSYMKEHIIDIITKFQSHEAFITSLKNNFKKYFDETPYNKIVDKFGSINTKWKNIQKSMETVSEVLEEAIYGHKQAKRQIERIIGQWINGDQTGYCFGFEGPPGIGKTSLAKKVAYCLPGENNEPRPFAFIAIGGSCNDKYVPYFLRVWLIKQTFAISCRITRFSSIFFQFCNAIMAVRGVNSK